MGMFDFLKRGGKVVEAHANDALDKAENKNPVVMAKQAIRDMEKELEDAVSASATVKTNHIKSEADVKSIEDSIATWKKQSEGLKAKYQSSDDEDFKNEVKGHVGEALDNISQLENELIDKKARALKAKQKADVMKKRVKSVSKNIEKAKGMLGDIKAQTEMAEAELKMNKNMNSNVSDSAMAMFDKMQESANNMEAEAEAYGDLADDSKSAQDRIDEILNAPTPGAATKQADDFLNS